MDEKSRTEWLHCLQMSGGSISGDVGHPASCFLIAEKTDDDVAIRRVAMALMNAGCRDFHFCGSLRELWHDTFDRVDIERTSDEKDWALTCDYGSAEEFARTITQEHAWCTDAPGDFYLIYDDEAMFGEVLRSLPMPKKLPDCRS